MKQIYTGKVESATFSNPPENSIIEFLWRDDKQLVANEIAINFADPEFLAFIKEYPLEKIEKAAEAAAKARSKAKKAYDKKIIDEYKKSILPGEMHQWRKTKEVNGIKDTSLNAALMLLDAEAPKAEDFNLLSYIDKYNNNKDIIFNCKLKILDEMLTGTKNKQLTLKIRRIKTLKNLLGIYYGSV